MKLQTMSRSLLAALALGLCATAAQAADAGPISVHDAWVRWLPGTLPSAGYATIENHGDKTITLISVDSDDYGMAMLHKTVKSGSTDKMIMVDKLDIPAHGKVAIEPGGYHLMLEHPQHPIKPGDTVHVKLGFSDGETLDERFQVRAPGAQQAGMKDDMKGMKGM